MSRRKITKAHREQLDRIHRGLGVLGSDIAAAKSADVLVAISTDLGSLANQLRGLANDIQRPAQPASPANRGMVSHPV